MAKKNFIAGAIKHPGAFTAKAKRAGSSVQAYARAKQHAPGKTGQQARLAMTLADINRHNTKKKLKKKR